MYHEMNQKMEEVQQGIFRFNKINSMLGELEQQKKELEAKATELKDLLEKENMDVDKLENKSLAHLFHTILGNIEEKKEQEQKEALAAKLKYDQAVGELEQLEAQMLQMKTEAVQFKDCKREYDSLYRKKAELLMASNSETAQRLMELSEHLKVSNNNRSEIKEAIAAGNEVISHTDNAISSLQSAEGWGTWDILGGGLLADMAKHSHIDDAKGEADMVQSKLSRFRTELADVRINNDIHFETDGFGKFADFFFDGLIADWCMQSKIEGSLESVQNVRSQVQNVLIKLSSMESMEAAHIEALENEMNELIVEA